MNEYPPIPVNLITGFLGVGKSTAIRHLLEVAVRANERWAVLVNEFGQVSVDPASVHVDSARVTIRELPGGCLCCTLGAPLRVTLTRLIREVRPDRLLIEPSGVGHPARVLDTLREEGLGSALDVRATLCLVDPRQLQDPRITEHPVFRDQVELADVLIANKQDLADSTSLAAFHSWAIGLFPPKTRIANASHGWIKPAWLDLEADPARFSRSPHFHASHGDSALGEPSIPPQLPLPGRPVRLPNAGQGLQACGWIFRPEDCFNRVRLLRLLAEISGPERIKGVFHCGRDWLLVDRVGEVLEHRACAWRTDSRVEILARDGEAPDWDDVERRLLECLTDWGA